MDMVLAVIIGLVIGGVFIDVSDTIEKYSKMGARLKQNKNK